MSTWLESGGIALGGVVIGAVSALIPIVNAEAVLAGLSASSLRAPVVALALALSCGQTIGKLVFIEVVRRGHAAARDRRVRIPPRWRSLLARRLRRCGPASRLRDWGAGAIRMLGCRWRGGGIVFMSAAVGVPPLAAVCVGCGVARTRRLDFALWCYLGRTLRFLALGLLLAAWND